MLEIRRPLGSILNRLNKKNEKNLFVKSGIGIFFVVIIMFLVQHIQASDIRADVDGQNGIDSTDAILTLRNSLGLDMSSTNQQNSATTGDVDCNNITNSTDAMLILRQSLGLDMSGTGWCIVSGKVPDWSAIKNGAKFVVYDSTYDEPYIQPINVRGWEDGLYITRDGLNLQSYFMPVDVFSLYEDRQSNPICFNSEEYWKEPLLGVDMISNPWGCDNFFQGGIIISNRNDTVNSFSQWQSSNLQRSISNEGAPSGVLEDENTFDVFVFTQNRNDTEDMEIMFLKDVSTNPNHVGAVPIVSSMGVENNPHIERLDENTLLLLFDRDRYMYYSISDNNGDDWSEPVQITNVLNDQAPYDVQPHLWNDGTDWWVYFSRDNNSGMRSIYKARQLVANDWNSWGTPELVIAPDTITGGAGVIIGIGEPSLTDAGDLSFVVIYGDQSSENTTDVYDCDPWFLPKK